MAGRLDHPGSAHPLERIFEILLSLLDRVSRAHNGYALDAAARPARLRRLSVPSADPSATLSRCSYFLSLPLLGNQSVRSIRDPIFVPANGATIDHHCRHFDMARNLKRTNRDSIIQIRDRSNGTTVI